MADDSVFPDELADSHLVTLKADEVTRVVDKAS